jgi:hypothetical protein
MATRIQYRSTSTGAFGSLFTVLYSPHLSICQIAAYQLSDEDRRFTPGRIQYQGAQLLSQSAGARSSSRFCLSREGGKKDHPQRMLRLPWRKRGLGPSKGEKNRAFPSGSPASYTLLPAA